MRTLEDDQRPSFVVDLTVLERPIFTEYTQHVAVLEGERQAMLFNQYGDNLLAD